MSEKWAVMPEDDYKDACDAVREKTGGTDPIKSGEMGAQIRAIKAGGDDQVITNASYLFYNNARVDSVDFLLSCCKGVNSVLNMFHNCYGITDLKMTDFDMSQVTDMNDMFNSANKLIDPDCGNWDTGKVKTMKQAFRGCTSVERLDVSKWNTENVTDMSYMFFICKMLKELDVGSWNTSKVTNMQNLFSGNSSQQMQLKTIKGLENWDTGNVVYMGQMFEYCSQIESLPIENWDTSKVTSLAGTFNGCQSLKKVDMSKWDTSKVTAITNIFQNCKNLKEIVGFSATNKAGLSIGFPKGSVSLPMALERLTFRTDLSEGVYSIRSAIDIRFCAMDRAGFLEMANTLPDVSSLGLNSSYTTITLTGNPCVSTTYRLPSKSTVPVNSYDDFVALADDFYGPYDRTGAEVTALTQRGITISVPVTDVTEEFFNENGLQSVGFKLFVASVPAEMRIDDSDRAVAVSRGWALVE